MRRLLAVLLAAVPTFAGIAPELPAVSIEDRAFQEGSSIAFPVRPATFTVTLSHPGTQPVSVDWTVESGTATPGDFHTFSGTVVIPAGLTSGTLSILIYLDFTQEPDETFFINLSNPVNATIADGRAQVTLLNDDTPPTVFFENASSVEGHSSGRQVVFDVPQHAIIGRVDYTTSDGTATAHVDYIPVSGTVTISVPVTKIYVDLIGDTIREPNETFFLNLSNPINVILGRTQVVGTIVNDDFHSDLSITKSGPALATAASPVTYNLLVSNAGPDAAPDVTLTDVLPAGATFVSATPTQGTCSGTTTVTCNFGAIATGATAAVALTVLTPNAPQPISNTATVASQGAFDPTPANNTSAAVITAPAATAAVPTLAEWSVLALLAALVATAVLKMR